MKEISKASYVFVAILLLSTFFSALTVIQPAQAADELKFGVIAPRSGPGSNYGVSMINGIEMAMEEVNGKITVGGKEYKLVPIIYDTKCNPAEGVAALEKLIHRDKVKIILGPLCSGVTSAVAPKIGNQVTCMVLGSIVSDYTKLGNPNIFRPSASVDSCKTGITDFLTKGLEVQNLGILAGKSSWSPELIEPIEERFKSEGRKLSVEWYDLRTTNMYPQLTSFGRKGVEGVLVTGYPAQGALMAKQAKELGMMLRYRLSFSSGTTEEYLKLASADLLEGFYDCGAAPLGAYIDAGHARAAEFEKTYKAKFGIGTSWPSGCNGYDVFYILKAGLENAGTVTDVAKMSAAIHNLGRIPETIIEYRLVNGKMFDNQNNAYMGGAIRQFIEGRFRFIMWTY